MQPHFFPYRVHIHVTHVTHVTRLVYVSSFKS